MNNKSSVKLSRDLGLFSVTMIGVGAMIGAGMFVLTGIAAGVAGPALLIVFVLNGFIAFLTAMAYAELGSCMPAAGGGYVWVKESLGGIQGFLSGWMSWFAQATACVSADLRTPITPCQFGGQPDCSSCGCMALMLEVRANCVPSSK